VAFWGLELLKKNDNTARTLLALLAKKVERLLRNEEVSNGIAFKPHDCSHDRM
jgi:hypothetical protein